MSSKLCESPPRNSHFEWTLTYVPTHTTFMHELQQTPKKSKVFSKKPKLNSAVLLAYFFHLLFNNQIKPMFLKVGQHSILRQPFPNYHYRFSICHGNYCINLFRLPYESSLIFNYLHQIEYLVTVYVNPAF